MCWRPDVPVGTAVAVDAENAGQPVPTALGRRHRVPAEQFWRDWTRAEVRAKLADVPVLVWISRHGLTDATGSGQVVTDRCDDLIVSVGVGTS